MTLVTCDNCGNQTTDEDTRLKDWVYKVTRSRNSSDFESGSHVKRTDVCPACVEKWFGDGQRKHKGKDGVYYFFITRSASDDQG